MATIHSYPNNQDVYIGAEEVMRWHYGRTSGVFAGGSNAVVAAVQGSMAVTVADGNGWISNAAGNGIAWWNSTEADDGSKLQLSIDASDSSNNRIDRIIVEWKTTTYADLPEIKVLKGTPASTAVAPALTNTSTTRQISLAQIFIAAGTTSITSTMITDERFNSSVCGLVTENVEADLSSLHAQYSAAVEEIQEAINDAWSGAIAKGAVSQTYYATIPASGWKASGDLYNVTVTVTGITEDDDPIVDVRSTASTDAIDAYGSVQKITTAANKITITATEAIETAIPIKMLCVRK